MKASLSAAVCAAALCAPLAALSTARAETAPSDAAAAPDAVETVVVTARRLDEPAVVQSARERLSRTPGAVAVVSQESFETRYAQTLADTLRGVAGVHAQKRWGEEVRFSIRGSGIGAPNHARGVLLAQDGVPFNQADGFGDFQEIDPLSVRYAEVFKGGNALRFGGATLGGAVNFVTPTGRDAPYRTRLRAETGSWDLKRLHAAAALEREGWDAWGALTAFEAGSWRPHGDGAALRGTINLGRRFGGENEARLIVSAADVRQNIPGALPLATALNAPRTTPAANIAGDYSRDLSVLRVSAQTTLVPAEGWRFQGGVYAAAKSLWHPIPIVIEQDSRNTGVFGRLEWSGEVFGGRAADLFVGAWARRGEIDAFVFTNAGGRRGIKTGDSLQTARAYDLFAEGRLFVTRSLAVIAGGTWGRAERDYDDRLVPARSAERSYDWFAPRLGLLWTSVEGDQLFANLTRSVEPPPFNALVQAPAPGFVPVRAQEAWTGEIGARGRREGLAWDVALFRAELDHELLNFIPGPDVPAATFNAGPTVHQGIEAALDARLWRGEGRRSLTLRQVWTWSDFRFDGDGRYGDNRLPVIPEHVYRAELKFDAGRWFAAPAVEWIPRDVWIDHANTLKAPGYAVWSLNLGATLAPGVTVFADARNLADERYVSNFAAVTDARVAPASVFWPGEGRALFVGLTWSR